ncbi:MAG: HAD family phosphatase [Endomicrobia bacterium]|nr:HAD family phosphatase [Endomicrobiia bacterium]MCX7941051.1 HAD family phosphatase [Endomicrobiia bacterium]MDW8056375.1 HAD family phosphatase [Elusimicrobiota bacterium]
MKNYLFDLDGVILNSMPYHAKAMREACAIFGIDLKEEVVLYNEGAITYDLLKGVAKQTNINFTMENFLEIINYHKKFFIEKYARYVKPFDGVMEILYQLKEKDKKLAIVTGSDKEIVDADLPKEIFNILDVIITSDRIAHRKPHPQPYLKALELLNAKVDESIAVENSPTGILSAKSAGLKCIAIPTTLPKEKLQIADLIVENHSELKKYLLNGF